MVAKKNTTVAVEATEVTVAPTLESLMAAHKTKSAVIRKLAADGLSRGAIAKFMGVRYQHVRNVLTQPLKKAVS